MDKQGRLYISALEDDAIKMRDGDTVTTLVKDERLRWPDSFAQGKHSRPQCHRCRRTDTPPGTAFGQGLVPHRTRKVARIHTQS